MVKPVQTINPLISIIIPCYNHGQFLANAIESVYSQTYQTFEIIVVDDGSVDNTKKVCNNYPDVTYIYQKNSGLSSARNTGIKYSKGAYLVFLDADDWLIENALKTNLDLLLKHKNIAFISGGHNVFYENTGHTKTVREVVKEDHYLKLLQGNNYIGMHATVMYQRWVFDSLKFDTSLPYCEDFDLYLKITKKHQVLHHTELIAVYRMHGSNMSSNYSDMLKYVLLILSKNEKNLLNNFEKKLNNQGISVLKDYYSLKIYEYLKLQINSNRSNSYNKEVKTLMINAPKLYAKFKINQTLFFMFKLFQNIKNILKKILPLKVIKRIQYVLYKQSKNKLPYKINLGDLNRTTPFSTEFGYDRGGPIDRYYIENFLNQNSSLVKGQVLEIGDNEYTLKYGGDKLTQSDILHVDDTNKEATYIGDLSDVPHLPSNTFDCIILTQTLHLIYDYKSAIETCYRVLKKGGVLLLTVPGISHIAQDQWRKYWLWSFTDASMEKIMLEHFPKDNVSIQTYGNVLVASAFLYGMGLPEIKKEQMDYHDPHYQVIISVRAKK
ncbi:glycosyltransferase [Mariniflexile sp.]|uniref:glycosyltransferase n=1 Tax=Mariniflexile sp. TaxID=1979402 RepID=UPI0035638AFF